MHHTPDAVTADLLSALTGLLRTTRSLAHRRTQALGPSGTAFALLKILGDGDARPGDLAARLCVAPSVVSRSLAQLERDGLVERRHDLEDARAWRIGLTDLGQRHIGAVHRAYVLALGEALTGWHPDDVRRAAALMTRLDDALGSDAIDVRAPELNLPLPTAEKGIA